MVWLLFGLWVGSFVGWSTPLRAESARTEDPAAVTQAREYFRAGARAYSVGAYAAAVQAFEQAYRVAPRPAVLFSIAQAEKKLFFLSREPGHLEKALKLYREYLASDPEVARKNDATAAVAELMAARPTPPPATVEQAAELEPPVPTPPPTRVMIASPTEGARISLDGRPFVGSPLILEVTPGPHRVRVAAPGHLSHERSIVSVEGSLVTFDVALREQPARLAIQAPEGAELSIDGRLQGSFPFPRALELSAGAHLIVVTQPGYEPFSVEQEFERGETISMSVRLPRTLQRTASLVMFGAAASAVTAGGVFGYFALVQQSSAESFLEERDRSRLVPADLAAYDSARRDRDNLRLASAISFGAAVALTAGGIVLYTADSKSAPARAKTARMLRAVPAVGPGLLALELSQSF